jgi:hypothetical protein
VPVRWARGLVRAWIVLAALWLIGAGVYAYKDPSIPALLHSCTELRGFVVEETGKPLGDADVAQCEEVWRGKRLTLFAWALWPLALLVVGFSLAWVIRGFRPENSN